MRSSDNRGAAAQPCHGGHGAACVGGCWLVSTAGLRRREPRHDGKGAWGKETRTAEHGRGGRVGQTAQNRLSRWPWSRYVGLVLCLVSSGLLTGSTGAAERTRPFRIGALTPSWGLTPQMAGLRDGLVELGYREDEDFVLGVRFTQGNLTELPTAARQLVQYGVDLVFVSEEEPAKAIHEATTRVPIVFSSVGDPVRLGLTASFAHPGGNITGVSDLARTLGPKRLEMLRELLSGLKRVLFLYDVNDASNQTAVKEYRGAARRLGVELVAKGVRTTAEAKMFLAAIRDAGIEGILAPHCCALNIPGLVQDATTQQGIPAIFDAAFWPDHGALASYGADYYASGKQAARLVDKIFKGAKPAELPVEVNPKIEFVVNLKTAKILGLTIPPEVLYRADRIVRWHRRGLETRELCGPRYTTGTLLGEQPWASVRSGGQGVDGIGC
jgi:putative ABC transport system substrate-binding protein